MSINVCAHRAYMYVYSLLIFLPFLKLIMRSHLCLSMHAYTGAEYVRTSFDPNAPGLQGLEWDSAELFRVSVCLSVHLPCVS